MQEVPWETCEPEAHNVTDISIFSLCSGEIVFSLENESGRHFQLPHAVDERLNAREGTVVTSEGGLRPTQRRAYEFT